MKNSTLLLLSIFAMMVSCTDNSTNEVEDLEAFDVYAFKYQENVAATLVGLDITNGTETVIATFEPNTKIHGFVYNEATQELIGVTQKNYDDVSLNQLYLIDVTDGTTTTVTLDNSWETMYYPDLELDAAGTLYAYKSNFVQYTGTPRKLVSINTNDGTETTVAEFNEGVHLYDLNYNATTSSIVCLQQYSFIRDILLDGGEGSGLSLQHDYKYAGLVHNASNEFYAFKEKIEMASDVLPELVSLDVTTGTETTLATFDASISLEGIAYDGVSDTYLGIQNQQELFQFNITTQTSSTIPLDTTPGVQYLEIITK